MNNLTLHDFHIANGAKLVPFAGWNMPISYGSGIEEHNATRKSARLFDVSHMGEIEVRGKNAWECLSYIATADLSEFEVGTAIYSPICNSKGGTIDDLILYRKKLEHFLLCVNAVNINKDYMHVLEQSKKFDCEVINSSNMFGQIAIQGPESESILCGILGNQILKLKKMEFVELPFESNFIMTARTGYTGEDGFEIYCKTNSLHSLVDLFKNNCQKGKLGWAGLAARDSLRLEAGYPLYGSELSEIYSPVQAGLNWSVGWEKEDFIGKNCLQEEKNGNFLGKVIHYEAQDRRIPRSGNPIIKDGKKVGEVLSGGFSPTGGIPIGSAWINKASWLEKEEANFYAKVRGKSVPISIEKPILKKLKCQTF